MKIKSTHILFFLSFILWVFSFRGFLFGELSLRDDAIPYYDHIKFFVDNLMHGVYPLWDPTWRCGVPNEFFLRRMGEFNPFFWGIFFLNKLGFSHYISYFIFVTSYYFLGLFGFYRLTKMMFRGSNFRAALQVGEGMPCSNNRASLETARGTPSPTCLTSDPKTKGSSKSYGKNSVVSSGWRGQSSDWTRQDPRINRGIGMAPNAAAFAAFLLMAFSSFIVLLFNSFIVLIFTPMVWFFYFLTDFTQRPRKHSFLGIVFTLMLPAITYLPFYFLTIVGVYLLCFVGIYWKNFKEILLRYVDFFRTNHVFVCICFLLLFMALLPGLMYFQDAAAGEFVLPRRHHQTADANAFAVNAQSHVAGGIVPIVIYERLFSNLQKFELGVFYVPVFAFICFLFGLVTKLNKRLVLFALMGFLMYLIGVYDSGPFYQFLYKHIFFFKYFRNFQFFLWLVILPAFILLSAEQLSIMLQYKPRRGKERAALLIFLSIVHMGFLVFLFLQKKVIISSHIVVILSWIFFMVYFLDLPRKKPLRESQSFVLGCLLVLILAQPLMVYHYLGKNSQKAPEYYIYDKPYMDFRFTRGEPPQDVLASGVIARKPPMIYYATSWYHFLQKGLDYNVFEKYIHHKWMAYDRVERLDDAEFLGGSRTAPTDLRVVRSLERVEAAFRENRNVAFIPLDAVGEGFMPTRMAAQAQIIKDNSKQFQVLDYDMNSIKVKTNFDTPKFLVYNDSFHSRWQAFMDGKPVDLWRANMAFKGLWVPAGEHTVFLRYGSVARYGFKWGMMVLFVGTFGWLIWLIRRRDTKSLSSKD